MKYRLAAVPKTAAIVVLGLLIAGGQFTGQSWLVVLLSVVLWTLLYAINESIDSWLEAGECQYRWVIPTCSILSLVCVVGGFIVGGFVSGVLLFLMVISQFVYCWPGCRAKRFVWAGPIQSGFLNPTLRFMLGANLGLNTATNYKVVLASYVLLISLHFAGAVKTRVYQTSRDRSLGYQTFSVSFVVRYIERLQYLTPICAGLLAFLICGSQGMISFPTVIHTIVIFSVTIGIFTIWAINDVYDSARHRLGSILLNSYGGSLSQAELAAGSSIAVLEARAGVPTIALLRNLWCLKVPMELIAPGRLILAVVVSFLLTALPLKLVPLTTVIVLIVFRRGTRPK